MPPPLSNTHLRTPLGFNELLTYLTREILRSQPENIYEFCLTTCQQLINERNNGILVRELIKLESTDHSLDNQQ
ncbi:unnamed protein product [Rotaria magnacalcarata]|uniref:RIIa domain-containing protein n=1 Tax=Rotaria magnacalcarata TaxID=392030 RepID=A0A816URD8_9BILA|nr:unnamed protein product [Rotaria magnacalcarata]CAF1509650.1 unnamed protein product [Rotaria magnacalcarata]CAF2117639.1 unnamed protein product [Rotaria magnacalcarata]CAF2195604.1 unnamed protein product [Rotaria magnacalcarata]CAF2218593.1 unnamed protein product [Rotaria magnacalcarata]